jgi:hypothetical protein
VEDPLEGREKRGVESDPLGPRHKPERLRATGQPEGADEPSPAPGRRLRAVRREVQDGEVARQPLVPPGAEPLAPGAGKHLLLAADP